MSRCNRARRGNYLPFTDSGTYSITIVAPDFSLLPGTAVLAVTNGQSTAPTTLQTNALDGFTGTVTFSCSGLPAGTACSFSQNSVAVGSSVTFTISTTQTEAVRAEKREPVRQQHPLAYVACAALLLMIGRKRRAFQRFMIVLLMLSPFSLLISCGSGSSGSSGSPGPPSSLNLLSQITLSATTLTPAKNAPDTLTAQVKGVNSGGPVATGTVAFSVDNVSTGTAVPLTNGVATTSATFTTAGSHTASAVYSGDANYASPPKVELPLSVPYTSGTPPGQYTFQINAVSGTLQHSVTMSIIVS